jgi:hypothetical protein
VDIDWHIEAVTARGRECKFGGRREVDRGGTRWASRRSCPLRRHACDPFFCSGWCVCTYALKTRSRCVLEQNTLLFGDYFATKHLYTQHPVSLLQFIAVCTSDAPFVLSAFECVRWLTALFINLFTDQTAVYFLCKNPFDCVLQEHFLGIKIKEDENSSRFKSTQAW